MFADNNVAVVDVALELAFLIFLGLIFAIAWRDILHGMVEAARSLRRLRVRLIDLFRFVAGCGLLFKILVMLGWPFPSWLDSAVVLVVMALVVATVACLLHALYVDLFERRRKRSIEFNASREVAGRQRRPRRDRKIRFPVEPRQTSFIKR